MGGLLFRFLLRQFAVAVAVVDGGRPCQIRPQSLEAGVSVPNEKRKIRIPIIEEQ